MDSDTRRQKRQFGFVKRPRQKGITPSLKTDRPNMVSVLF